MAIWRTVFLQPGLVGQHKLHTARCKFDIADILQRVLFFLVYTGSESDKDSRVCMCVSFICQEAGHEPRLLLESPIVTSHACAQISMT